MIFIMITSRLAYCIGSSHNCTTQSSLVTAFIVEAIGIITLLYAKSLIYSLLYAYS